LGDSVQADFSPGGHRVRAWVFACALLST
jgi:hypothetical protein